MEQIEDEAERRQVQRQARGVIARTALASSLLTLAAFLLPASG